MDEKFDFEDPGGPPYYGMVCLPVVDLRHMEIRLRDNIVNSERRLFRKTVFLAAVSVAAGLLLSKII